MAESLNIRKSTKSDSRTIFNVVNAAYKATVGDTGKAYKTCNRFANIDQVEKLLDIFWVGELGGKIVGVVGIEVIGDMVDIGPLAVSTKYQKMGIGGKLLDFAEERGVVACVQVMSLITSNLAMYLKRGYEEVKELPIAEVLPLHTLSRHDLTVKYLQRKKIKQLG